MSQAYKFTYTELIADTGEVVLKVFAATAIEGFKHPDFDKKQFSVHECETSLQKGIVPDRTWFTNVHVVRDGVIIQKRFSFKCCHALKTVKQINQIDRAAIKPSTPKKALKERAGIL